MTASEIKIITVDDNKTFLQSINFFLSNVLKYTVINQASSGVDFLRLSNVHEANIILMDIEMPELNGIQTTKAAIKDYSALNIIALTNYEEKAYLMSLITAGFKGCVFKKNTFEQINIAIHTVLDGKMYFPQNILNPNRLS